MSSDLSQDIVAQRIRNRRIEWLEIVAVVDDDPWSSGLGSLVNLWFDWNPDAPAVADSMAATRHALAEMSARGRLPED